MTVFEMSPSNRGDPRRFVAGFTLAEAMVSITIMGILLGITTVGVVRARQGYAVRVAAHQFAGHVREATLLAVNGVKDAECQKAADAVSGELARSLAQRSCSVYKIVFTPGSSTYYREPAAWDDGSYGPITYTLPGGAKFTGTGPENKLTFTYTPPTVAIEGNGGYSLEHISNPQATARVCIEHRGAVEVRAVEVGIDACT